MTSPFNFQRVSELQPAEALTTCIYGPSGSGKTDLMGSAGSRNLIINIGSGEETLKSPSFKNRRNSADPIIVTIKEQRETTGSKDATGYYKVLEAMDYALAHMNDQFDFVSIDDITALNKMSMGVALDMNFDGGDKAKSQTKSQISKWGIALPAIQDFGTQMGLLDWVFGTYIPLLKEHKKHLIVCAHERWTYTKPPRNSRDTPTLIAISPAVTGADKNPDGFVGHFDNVWRTFTVSGGDSMAYRMLTKGNEIIRAKTRTGGVLNETENNPNFLEILGRLQSGKLKETKK